MSRFSAFYFLFVLVLACSSFAARETVAQAGWAEGLFDEKKHDFGTVSQGAQAEYRFTFKNTLDKDILITKLKTSCGCTSPSIKSGRVKPGEESAVVAKFNTTSFTGAKTAVITVVFAEPNPAEVQLSVSGDIRTDISVQPSEVNFGSFRDGDAKPIILMASFTGTANWAITDVRSQFSQLQVSLDNRTVEGSKVTYQVKVGLKPKTPEGPFRERMTLVTNAPNLPTFSIDVLGRVEPDLILTPASLNLGTLPKGGQTSKRLVLRGPEPFAVTDVKCKDRRFQFDKPEGKKTLHFVTVRFSSGQVPGKVFESIEIETDMGSGSTAKCPVSGEVL